MNETQRAQVGDNARYLREVRPIDPEEICEYVEGAPHPAAVRQVLREQAPELGLLERPDGRFEPPPDDRVEASARGVDALPESCVRAIEELLVERFGPGWPDGESGARLRRRIRTFKRRYLEGSPVEYDELTALGYAIYHLPASYAAVQYVLARLAGDGLLGRQLRILDVGAGVGGQALGIDRLFEDVLVEYHAVEPSAGADVLERLLEETGRNVHPTVHREPIESFEPPVGSGGGFDLVIAANVLSELDQPATQLARALEWLSPDGSVVALAPADRNTATGLRRVERDLERRTGATIYAPTVRLWPDESPASDSWSFERRPDLSVPPFQRRLDEGERTTAELDPDTSDTDDRESGGTTRRPGDGEFVNVDVQYAYSVLRRDDRRRLSVRPDPDRSAKLADSEHHVTDRIDCAAVKLSHDLSEGENALFLVGDGSQQVDHFAVLTEESTLNDDLREAAYGDGLRFANVLVLWNEDEQAVNLVVDGETLVDRIPA